MPVICCRCNASGRCKNCSCKKAGKECSNCLPCRRGHCENLPPGERGAHGPTTMITSLNEQEGGDRDIQHSPIQPRNTNVVEQNMAPSISETQIPSQPEIQLTLEQDIDDLPTYTPVPEPNFRWGETEDGI